MSNKEIAQTIIQQLGNGRFVAFTGAKNFMAIENGVQFDLPRTRDFVKDGINRVTITLEPSDTYKMVFSNYRPRKMVIDEVTSRNNVYCDQLQSIFTDVTGLDTHF